MFLVTFVICDLIYPLIESSHCNRWTQTSKLAQGSGRGFFCHSLRTACGLNKPGLWFMSSTTSPWRNFMVGRRWTWKWCHVHPEHCWDKMHGLQFPPLSCLIYNVYKLQVITHPIPSHPLGIFERPLWWAPLLWSVAGMWSCPERAGYDLNRSCIFEECLPWHCLCRRRGCLSHLCTSQPCLSFFLEMMQLLSLHCKTFVVPENLEMASFFSTHGRYFSSIASTAATRAGGTAVVHSVVNPNLEQMEHWSPNTRNPVELRTPNVLLKDQAQNRKFGDALYDSMTLCIV